MLHLGNLPTFLLNVIDENDPYKGDNDFLHSIVYSDFKGVFRPVSLQDYPFWITLFILIFLLIFLLILKTNSETFISQINHISDLSNNGNDFEAKN